MVPGRVYSKYYDYSPTKQRYVTDTAFRRKYGISLDGYLSMGHAQSWRCAICKTHQSDLNRALAVDHNHATGKVRALLCPSCNWKVGFVETVAAQRIHEYINRFSGAANV